MEETKSKPTYLSHTVPPFLYFSGQAEDRMVQATKYTLKRIILGDWKLKFAQFLLSSHHMSRLIIRHTFHPVNFFLVLELELFILHRFHLDYSPSKKDSEEL